jgi:hypothetical protein
METKRTSSIHGTKLTHAGPPSLFATPFPRPCSVGGLISSTSTSKPSPCGSISSFRPVVPVSRSETAAGKGGAAAAKAEG